MRGLLLKECGGDGSWRRVAGDVVGRCGRILSLHSEHERLTMIEIDKNIPIPPKRNQTSKYPLSTMEVGDSFLVVGAVQARLSGSVGTVARRTGRKFTTRKTFEGVRVWRIS